MFAFIITLVPGSSYLLMIASYLNIFTFGALCFYCSFDIGQLRSLAGYNPLEIVSEQKKPNKRLQGTGTLKVG